MNKWWSALLSVLTGVAVLLSRFPYYGTDDLPPHHFNLFNQEISNDNGLVALASAFTAGALVWLITGVISRRRQSKIPRAG